MYCLLTDISQFIFAGARLQHGITFKQADYMHVHVLPKKIVLAGLCKATDMQFVGTRSMRPQTS
jgi:hypothetical protein